MATKKRKPAGPSATPLTDGLRQAIERQGLSGYAVAKAAGVSQAVIQRWTAGSRGISLATADKIAAAFGLKVIESEGNQQ